MGPESDRAAFAPLVITGGLAPSPATAAPPADAQLGPAGPVRKMVLTSWEAIWYIVLCIPLGAAYLSKVPAKKALSDFGLTELTSAERFWYVVECIFFGAGYFAKIPTAKALSELPQHRAPAQQHPETIDN
jgi:hypothetical protein